MYQLSMNYSNSNQIHLPCVLLSHLSGCLVFTCVFWSNAIDNSSIRPQELTIRCCSSLPPSTVGFSAVNGGAVAGVLQEDRDLAAIILSLHDVWHCNVTAIWTSCTCRHSPSNNRTWINHGTQQFSLCPYPAPVLAWPSVYEVHASFCSGTGKATWNTCHKSTSDMSAGMQWDTAAGFTDTYLAESPIRMSG